MIDTDTRSATRLARSDLPDSALAGRLRRAYLESMTIRPLGANRYIVETEGGTYVVDTDEGSCTCPDAAIRGVRCKHQWRVTIDERTGAIGTDDRVCGVCGEPLSASNPTLLCPQHRPERGEFVRDRETGGIAIVIAVTPFLAEEYTTPTGEPIATYPSNANYGDHEPVVLASYTGSIGPDTSVEDAPRYAFPASRLVRFEDDRQAMRFPGFTERSG